MYLPVNDHILSELNLRFSANNNDPFNSLDAFNPQSPHFLNFLLISSFASLYGIASDDDLITECRLATRTFSTKKLESVSSVYTDLLQLQAAFPTLKKLFQIALTLVVSMAHCGVSPFTGLEEWTGRVDWTTGLDYWTGLLDWNTGLENWTLFRVKNKFNMSIFIIVINIMQQKIILVCL